MVYAQFLNESDVEQKQLSVKMCSQCILHLRERAAQKSFQA